MNYRILGKTGLKVSEIGLGAEWLERHNTEEVKEIIDTCEQQGINILDCWMSGTKCPFQHWTCFERTPGKMVHSGTYWFHLAEQSVCQNQRDAKGERSF